MKLKVSQLRQLIKEAVSKDDLSKKLDSIIASMSQPDEFGEVPISTWSMDDLIDDIGQRAMGNLDYESGWSNVEDWFYDEVPRRIKIARRGIR